MVNDVALVVIGPSSRDQSDVVQEERVRDDDVRWDAQGLRILRCRSRPSKISLQT